MDSQSDLFDVTVNKSCIEYLKHNMSTTHIFLCEVPGFWVAIWASFSMSPQVDSQKKNPFTENDIEILDKVMKENYIDII